jgi:hypothetical protein
MSILQPPIGAFMKGRSRAAWVAGALLCGLAGAAHAEVAGTPPAHTAVANTAASSHRPIVRSTDQAKRHAQNAKPEKTPAAQPVAKQPEPDYGAALSQYQLTRSNTDAPLSAQPGIGDPGYAAGTSASDLLKRHRLQNGAPAPASSAGQNPAAAAAPDDNWRFMANPLINATHIHEVGAAVSVRHDFW